MPPCGRACRYRKGEQIDFIWQYEWWEMHEEIMIVASEAVLPLGITCVLCFAFLEVSLPSLMFSVHVCTHIYACMFFVGFSPPNFPAQPLPPGKMRIRYFVV